MPGVSHPQKRSVTAIVKHWSGICCDIPGEQIDIPVERDAEAGMLCLLR